MQKESVLQKQGSQEFPIGVFAQSLYMPQPHHHIEYEFFYLDDGRADFFIDGKHHTLYPGDCVFLEPETEHYVKSVLEGEKFFFYAIVFDSSIFGKSNDPCRTMFESIRIKPFPLISNSLSDKMKKCINNKKESVFGCDLMMKAILYEIISYILNTKQYEVVSPFQNSGRHNNLTVDKAIVYIREHFKENFGLDDVLNTTNYSKSHFCRMFKDSTGMSITEYINKFRVEKSCLELIYTDRNITEIATENGFNNIQYFSRVFRQFMGCTPKQYQKKAKDVVIPSSIPNSRQLANRG